MTFRLPAERYAQLDIFDLAGRLVIRVWDGPAAAGMTTLVWDGVDGRGRQMPSGTYFARLVAGDVVRTGVMMLVR